MSQDQALSRTVEPKSVNWVFQKDFLPVFTVFLSVNVQFVFRRDTLCYEIFTGTRTKPDESNGFGNLRMNSTFSSFFFTFFRMDSVAFYDHCKIVVVFFLFLFLFISCFSKIHFELLRTEQSISCSLEILATISIETVMILLIYFVFILGALNLSFFYFFFKHFIILALMNIFFGGSPSLSATEAFRRHFFSSYSRNKIF